MQQTRRTRATEANRRQLFNRILRLSDHVDIAAEKQKARINGAIEIYIEAAGPSVERFQAAGLTNDEIATIASKDSNGNIFMDYHVSLDHLTDLIPGAPAKVYLEYDRDVAIEFAKNVNGTKYRALVVYPAVEDLKMPAVEVFNDRDFNTFRFMGPKEVSKLKNSAAPTRANSTCTNGPNCDCKRLKFETKGIVQLEDLDVSKLLCKMNYQPKDFPRYIMSCTRYDAYLASLGPPVPVDLRVEILLFLLFGRM
ncbi:hypothetical protein G7Y89_g10096 [Cudoniella acicularis]|uniref:Uncharacterized protein n=1 Tax=Cudoniella acicularis TaxID=354080 RepID=A0A8H4W1Z1_9HELO|nr:hypothetical protein G7Y89_g10096 [Cudoniella acicularis]